jgi:hypothetical protein
VLGGLFRLELSRRERFSAAGVAFARIWPMLDTVDGLLLSPMQDFWLFKSARSLRDGARIVEIGSFKGRSTCALGYGCRCTGKHVWAHDTFDGNDVDFAERGFRAEFEANLARSGLTEYVTAVTGCSRETVDDWDGPIDLLFIDGSHVFEDAVGDFDAFFPYVRPGGTIAVHDVLPDWEGVYRAWHEHIAPKLENRGACATLAYGTKPSAASYIAT